MVDERRKVEMNNVAALNLTDLMTLGP